VVAWNHFTEIRQAGSRDEAIQIPASSKTSTRTSGRLQWRRRRRVGITGNSGKVATPFVTLKAPAGNLLTVSQDRMLPKRILRETHACVALG
jgi:hypothetical protein